MFILGFTHALCTANTNFKALIASQSVVYILKSSYRIYPCVILLKLLTFIFQPNEFLGGGKSHNHNLVI